MPGDRAEVRFISGGAHAVDGQLFL